MKTLNEEVNAIKAAKISKSAKRAKLAKLGITDYEIGVMLAALDDEAPIRGRFTFGVEIECFVNSGAIRNAAITTGMAYEYEGYNHRDGHNYFKFVSDGSVCGMADPIECVSPVLTGTDGKNALKNACQTLNTAGANVNQTCGLHVHIGAAKLTARQYCNVFVNYVYLEALIDTFMAPSRRGNNNQYASTLRNHITYLSHATSREDVRRELGSRYHKVNAESYARHKTIEFRQHAGTTNYEKIINWVNFCGKLVIWSKTHRLEAPITSIDDIPFLSAQEKAFFKARANQLGA